MGEGKGECKMKNAKCKMENEEVERGAGSEIRNANSFGEAMGRMRRM